MDVSSLAMAFAGAQTAQLQMAAAAKMMQMNAQAQAQGAVVQVIEAAQENMKSLVVAGLGGNLDISA
jgi:hypothetical protein